MTRRRGNTIAASAPATRASTATIAARLSLPESAARSVLGRASTAGQATDITSSADGDVLRRNAGSVGWGAIPEASVTNLVTDLAAKVATTRTINTTAPLSGGGDLSADRTLSISTNGISNTLIRQGSALSVIGRSANSTGDVADIAGTAEKALFVTAGSVLGFGYGGPGVQRGTASVSTSDAATGTSTGMSWTVAAGGVYLLTGSGSHTAGATTTGVQLALVRSGGCTLTYAQMWVTVFTGAAAVETTFTSSTTDGFSAGANSSGATERPIYWGAMIIVNAGGTLTLQLRSEVGASAVTLPQSCANLLRIA